MKTMKLSVVDFLSTAWHGRPLIVVDDAVIDLEGFLEAHPGGVASLMMNIGRDASADFHHVAAHHKKAVAERIGQRTTAQCPFSHEGERESHSSSVWRSLVDHAFLLHNGFAIQLDAGRELRTRVVNVGRYYCQLVQDHIPAFSRFAADFSAGHPTVDPRSARSLAGLVCDSVEAALSGEADPILALKSFEASAGVLLDGLVECGLSVLSRQGDRGHEIATAERMSELLHWWLADQEVVWQH